MSTQGKASLGGLLLVAALSVGCADPLAVEPLLGEGNEFVKLIMEENGQSKEIASASALLKEFLDKVSGPECHSAWPLLSEQYRQRVVELAGDEQQALKETCAGRVLTNDGLVQHKWRDLFMGPYPAYLTTAPGEIPLRMPQGRSLFFVVQQDGGYRAFVLVSESGTSHIEPFF